MRLSPFIAVPFFALMGLLPASTTPAAAGCVAIATAVSNQGIAFAIGEGTDCDEAKADAKRACINVSGRSCKVKMANPFSCLFATTGNKRNGVAVIGYGGTAEGALGKCREIGGVNCQDPPWGRCTS